MRLEFSVAPQTAEAGLISAGLMIVNPPWTLAGELKAILPELEKPLGQGGAGRFRLETAQAIALSFCARCPVKSPIGNSPETVLC